MWTEQSTTSLSTLQLAGSLGPTMYLSPDGLRLVVSLMAVEAGTYYLERPSLADVFSPAARLGVPPTSDPFLLADCSRLYFSDIGSVFFVHQ